MLLCIDFLRAVFLIGKYSVIEAIFTIVFWEHISSSSKSVGAEYMHDPDSVPL